MSEIGQHSSMTDGDVYGKRRILTERADMFLGYSIYRALVKSIIFRFVIISEKVAKGPARLLIRQAVLQLMTAMLAVIALGACASNEYMGISLKPGRADPQLQELVRRAQAGDKRAQLELGIRYEEGDAVPVDLRRARKLYVLAVADEKRVVWVYSPPTTRASKGYVIPVVVGLEKPGLKDARERLQAIDNRRVR
ncbi:hypothetical protein [Sphingobium sp. LSP13-1-1.1]|uniref:hypothetical protein n=1 Tax=Sphingobium sp. LSP13-1-1.1 TaxID=3135234 RepID=UPI0034417194